MAVGWAPFAVRLEGPINKTGYAGTVEPLPKLGAVYHSMEGGLASALRELEKQERRASWTFSNPKQGQMLQHYHAQSHTWANGSKAANVKFVSCENEGMAGQALTKNQVDNLVELTVWLYRENGWTKLERQVTLWEHNEMTQFGAPATACPSGRIPWATIIARAEQVLNAPEEESMVDLVAYRDQAAEFWLVATAAKTQTPIFKRQFPNPQVELELESNYGPSKKVGTQGAYNQGQWDSIPIVV